MSENSIAIIAAMSKNRVIGKDGHLPWDLPKDREHFKNLTMGQVIIMGRRSYEEIGRPLPGRVNYVISSTMSGEESIYIKTSLTEAIAHAKETYPQKKIFLCGGARIYEEGMALAEEIYLTIVEGEFLGDVYFPEIAKEFVLTEKEKLEKLEFVTYQRMLES